MVQHKVYVLVQYANKTGPEVVYSRPVDGNLTQLWQDTASVLSAKLREAKDRDVLITVYGPSGVFPEGIMAHRWSASPPELDVFHFGNLWLV